MVRIFWKVQVSGLCFFFSSRKRDLSRKINLNIFNVEEDVKVRYILEFNYTVCIYICIFEYANEFFRWIKKMWVIAVG